MATIYELTSDYESKFALDAEQHAEVVNLSDELADSLRDLAHSQLPSEA